MDPTPTSQVIQGPGPGNLDPAGCPTPEANEPSTYHADRSRTQSRQPGPPGVEEVHGSGTHQVPGPGPGNPGPAGVLFLVLFLAISSNTFILYLVFLFF